MMTRPSGAPRPIGVDTSRPVPGPAVFRSGHARRAGIPKFLFGFGDRRRYHEQPARIKNVAFYSASKVLSKPKLLMLPLWAAPKSATAPIYLSTCGTSWALAVEANSKVNPIIVVLFSFWISSKRIRGVASRGHFSALNLLNSQFLTPS